MVDLRSVPLPVSTLWAGDSLVNRHTYTIARAPILGGQVRSAEAIANTKKSVVAALFPHAVSTAGALLGSNADYSQDAPVAAPAVA